MGSKILITGATDGIGLGTAKMLASAGHHVLLHGRNPAKLASALETLPAPSAVAHAESYLADLSSMADVEALADAVSARHGTLDVLINNAGVFSASETLTRDGLDLRFAVNTLAPYLLTQRLLPLLGPSARVVNLSSAAQSRIDAKALAGEGHRLSDYDAYAQSKLALTLWSHSLAVSLGDGGPAIIAVNPGSLLGTKMVKEAFGQDGGDVQIGVKILCQAALDDRFAKASGQYFDNDAGQFALPHRDAQDAGKSREIIGVIESILRRVSPGRPLDHPLT